VNQLYSEHRGDVRLAATIDSHTFNTSHEGTNISYLDATVSRTADGKRVFIKAVNTSQTSALVTTITLQGVIPSGQAEVRTVTATTLDVANSFSRPDAVRLQTKTQPSGSNFVVTLPKHSISVIVLRTP
jgi:alpha-L-arabinofuranosidase